MTGLKLAIISALIPVGIAGAGVGAKLYGDTQWVPIGSYEQQKLFDLQDRIFELKQEGKYSGGLSNRQQEAIDRLLKREQQLQQKMNSGFF